MLIYASPRFVEAFKMLGLGEEKRQEIVDQVMSDGTCQHIQELPQPVRDTFVVSGDITAEEYVRILRDGRLLDKIASLVVCVD